MVEFDSRRWLDLRQSEEIREGWATRQQIVDTTVPGWSAPPNADPNRLQGIQNVQAGVWTASTSWKTPNPGSSSWNGAAFQTYVAQPFFDLSLHLAEVVNMHELSHPHLGTSNDLLLPSDQQIMDSCDLGGAN